MVLSSSAILDGFTITGGYANGSDPNYSGDGMYNRNNSSPTIINVVFTKNSGVGGSGIYNSNSSPVITNATFTLNYASYGGGIENHGSSPIFNNCIIWGNTASVGNQFYIESGTVTLNYSCYANEPNDVYGTPTTNSCTNSNPRFVNANGNDFRLFGNSPCVDTGNDSYAPATDIRGVSRPQGIMSIWVPTNGWKGLTLHRHH